MDKALNKTNKTWYPYEEFGSFFKLEEGTLVGCPMNEDGTRDNTPFEVDWNRGVEAKDQKKMKEFAEQLRTKD